MLFDVLSSFMGRPKELAFIKFHGDIYLVHTKKGEEQDLKWLDNFIIEEEELKQHRHFVFYEEGVFIKPYRNLSSF